MICMIYSIKDLGMILHNHVINSLHHRFIVLSHGIHLLNHQHYKVHFILVESPDEDQGVLIKSTSKVKVTRIALPPTMMPKCWCTNRCPKGAKLTRHQLGSTCRTLTTATSMRDPLHFRLYVKGVSLRSMIGKTNTETQSLRQSQQ